GPAGRSGRTSHMPDEDVLRDQRLQVADVRGEDRDLAFQRPGDDGQDRVDGVFVTVQPGVGQEAAGRPGLVLADGDDADAGKNPVPPLLADPAVVGLDERHGRGDQLGLPESGDLDTGDHPAVAVHYQGQRLAIEYVKAQRLRGAAPLLHAASPERRARRRSCSASTSSSSAYAAASSSSVTGPYSSSSQSDNSMSRSRSRFCRTASVT